MTATKEDIKKLLEGVSTLIYESEFHLEFENACDGESICFEFDKKTGKLILMYS